MAQTYVAKAKVKQKKQFFYDYGLFVLTLFLAGFGLVMIYSTSAYTAQRMNLGAGYFFNRQAMCVVIGIAMMVIVSKIDYRMFLRKVPVLRIRWVTLGYFISIGLQLAVLAFGVEKGGAKRWIVIGGQQFQPSEIAKVVTILFVSYIIFLAPKKMNNVGGVIRIFAYMSPIILLIGMENMSTAIVICAITVGISFVASKKKNYYFIVAVVLVAVAAAYIFLGEGFRAKRIDIWLNVESHADAFQILQGLYAIASGGLFGTGLGESMQKLGFIPEAHNDMIFSVICEELGLFGAAIVILIFIMLIWRILIIAISAPDLYGGLVCVGVMVHIAVQVIINIAVVTNAIPSTGIPLPFISYGGTSVTILLAEMGLVLSVSNQIRT